MIFILGYSVQVDFVLMGLFDIRIFRCKLNRLLLKLGNSQQKCMGQIFIIIRKSNLNLSFTMLDIVFFLLEIEL